MRLCDITQFYSPTSGGVRRYLHNKMDYVRAHPGHAMTLIVPGERDATREDGPVRIHTVRSPRLPLSLDYRVLLNRRRINEIITHERPDLVEVGDPYQLGWYALSACRPLGIPVVAFHHSDYLERRGERLAAALTSERLVRRAKRYLPSYLRALYRRLDAVLVAARRVHWRLQGLRPRRLLLAPLGVNTEFFAPRAEAARSVRAEHDIPLDAPLLFYAGRLSGEKGIQRLAAAQRRLRADGIPSVLVLAGDGQLRRRVQTWVRAVPGMRWLRHIEDANALARLYNAADVFVHAGLNETFGIAPLEAQACGTPVVAIAGSGLEEAVGVGALAAIPSPRAFAAAVQEVLAGQRAAQREAARAWVCRHFALSDMLARQFAQYQKLIAEARP